jgi:DUF4097 and DUF4098 domain-containing protein YvlB
MKKSNVAIIVAVCLIFVGSAILFAGLIAADFNFDDFASEQFEETANLVEGSFEHISVSTQIHTIELIKSDNGECKIIYDKNDNFKLEYVITDNTLTLKIIDDREWYDYIGIFTEKATLTLYLPESKYQSLSVVTNTGDVTIPGTLAFTYATIAASTGSINISANFEENLSIAVSTGNITLKELKLKKLSASVSTGNILLENVETENELKLECSTGSIELYGINAESIVSTGSQGDILIKNTKVQNEIKIKRSTGDVTLTNTTADSFKIKTSTGDVKLNSSDAESIDIETDTGKVEGSLLSEKIFVTNSGTGNIQVPSTNSGGTCKIRTSTGDIRITID